MSNSGRDIGIFEYCQYVMGMLYMNLVLPASGCNQEKITGLLQNENEINCIQ